MCGIVGFTGGRQDEVLAKMNDRQHHRGPDDRGVAWCERHGVSLAMTRLAIIDLDHGHQPMSTPDGRHTIVFNGEIFNAPELREELARDGATLLTDHSDTEVLLQLFARQGPAILPRLNGLFAFVVLDRETGELFGARDRFGIKPLYVSRDGGRLTFASELKALLEAPWVSRDLDVQAIAHYLSLQAVPSPSSIFSSVTKVEPASWFRYDVADHSFVTGRYWCPSFHPETSIASVEDAADALRAPLARAVERWSLADVEVACSLSGGLDSSLITALASTASTRLRTFTLGFEDAPHLDERALARAVADRYGTDHHEIVIRSEDVLAALDDMVWHLDEPYAGGLPSWFIFQAMGQEVKVGLTGVGGDELFGNYGKWWPYEPVGLARWRGGAQQATRRPGEAYHPMMFGAVEKAQVFPASVGLEPTEELVTRRWRATNAVSPRDAVAGVDLGLQLPDEFLHMLDRFSMAHSVEARTPLLDNNFVEAALAVPASIRTSRRSLKQVVRRLGAGLLPPEVLGAHKRGFVLPLDRWLRGPLRPLVEEHLRPAALEQQALFGPAAWNDVALPHLSGARDRTEPLWTLLMFQAWYGRFVGWS